MDDALDTTMEVAATDTAAGRGYFKKTGGRGKPAVVCTICGHHGPAALHAQGSPGMELLLWIAFLLPGLVYRLWRTLGRRQMCSACGASHVVSANSPLGRRLMMAQAKY